MSHDRSRRLAVQPLLRPLAVVAGAVSAGVGSGMMYVFSTGVMHGVGRLPQPEAVRAMQAINEAVINPWFLTVFLGTGLFLAGLAGLDVAGGGPNPWLVAGAAVYVAGVVVVTIGGNVPLNDALAALDAGTLDPGAWEAYARPWLRLNHLRAGAGALSSALLMLAALR